MKFYTCCANYLARHSILSSVAIDLSYPRAHVFLADVGGLLQTNLLSDFVIFLNPSQTHLEPPSQVYISTMESKKYPYTATQWHPEKNAFEWGDKLHIPHSKGAIDVTYAGERQSSAALSIYNSLHEAMCICHRWWLYCKVQNIQKLKGPCCQPTAASQLPHLAATDWRLSRYLRRLPPIKASLPKLVLLDSTKRVLMTQKMVPPYQSV